MGTGKCRESDEVLTASSNLEEKILIEFTADGDGWKGEFLNEIPDSISKERLYANASIIKQGKRFFVLTAKDCLDSLKEGKAIIDGDIAAFPIQKNHFRKASKIRYIQEAETIETFLSFVAVQEQTWKIRTVKGPVVNLPEEFQDSLEVVLRENLSILLDIESRNTYSESISSDSIETVRGVMNHIRASYAQQYVFLNSYTLDEMVKEIASIEYFKARKSLYLVIPPFISSEMASALGSSLKNKKGEIIGVNIGLFHFNGKVYMRFAPMGIVNELPRK
ncbi:hypothetical protein HC823_00680 [Candidatus Gracilibacteria bacterium]|nr:hypothetical protein [Candidatus Gracilibacteria bacterium]